MDAKTLSISSVECLLRWSHIDHGVVSTETLIDIAEESGLILPLGRWVIFEACRQFREWLDADIDLQSIAVNVSSEQFRRSDVVEVVQDALQEYDVDPCSLVIEITEGVMMIDEEKTLLALEELKKLGVGIALDDFGTGYSSLSYVHRFPVDILKIDRSFVADVETEEGSRAIATAVIALGHQLGLKIVGEGVENKLQERFLMENGCEEVQGYLYSKPLPAVEIGKLLPRKEDRKAL
jgi:EAL domain-containing protein (putative c-di-GMP-specific phosphodiesterase class I)